MGFLSMIGAVSAEEHAKVKLERDDAQAALRSAEADRDGWKQKATAPRAATVSFSEYQQVKNELATTSETLKGVRAALTTAEEIIADLKPDAEAMRKKRRDDRDREAAKRLKAATAKLDAEFGKTSTSPANIGVRKKPYRIDLKHAGKPRAAIPAKVGKSASAKVSGGRPAKKAVRK